MNTGRGERKLPTGRMVATTSVDTDWRPAAGTREIVITVYIVQLRDTGDGGIIVTSRVVLSRKQFFQSSLRPPLSKQLQSNVLRYCIPLPRSKDCSDRAYQKDMRPKRHKKGPAGRHERGRKKQWGTLEELKEGTPQTKKGTMRATSAKGRDI